MINLFETDNYPDEVPSELVAGTLFAWKRSDITAAYPTASYTLKFRLVMLVDPFTEYDITASKTGEEHVVQQTDTASFAAGEYRWYADITRDSDSVSVQVDEGLVTLRPAAGQDDSHTYRVLQAIRAVIEGTASREEESYSINGRSLSLRSPEDLLLLEKEYAKRWRNEKAAIERKAGRSSKSRILVKMEA